LNDIFIGILGSSVFFVAPLLLARFFTGSFWPAAIATIAPFILWMVGLIGDRMLSVLSLSAQFENPNGRHLLGLIWMVLTVLFLIGSVYLVYSGGLSWRKTALVFALNFLTWMQVWYVMGYQFDNYGIPDA
jgi:hypothetical protein